VTVSSPGDWGFYSVATDQTGQSESKPQIAEDEVTVDLSPPSITASVLDTLVAGNKVRVTIDALDDLRLDHVRVEFMPADGSAQWKMVHNFSGINKPDYKVPTADVTLTGAADGKQKVRFVAVDAAGQTTASAESEVTLDLTRPTVTSITPSDGAGNVSVGGPFVVTFSEPMNQTSALAAIKVSGGVSVTKIDWSGGDATLTLTGVSGASTYTLTVGAEAQDLAGNRMLKGAETKFTTVPTHGSLVGSLRESGGAVVRGAVLAFKLGGETIVVNVSKDGSFTIDPIRGGRWAVHGEARGYLPLDTSVDVTAGEQRRADLVMEKDQMPTIIGATVGLAVLGVVLFLVMRILRKKCPRCDTVLPRSASACSICGQVLRQRAKLDIKRDARLAREAESASQRKAIAAQYKQQKAMAAAAGPGAGAVTGPVMAARMAPRSPRPRKCFACKADLKPEDEWCPKCHQAIGSGAPTQECEECGSSVVDGVCGNCGWTPPATAAQVPATSPGVGKEESAGARTMDEPSTEPGTQVAPVRPPSEPDSGVATPPSSEGNVSCPTCSSTVKAGTPFCEVCGEPLKK
jgi:predicted amidophosphoribosyltransferase